MIIVEIIAGFIVEVILIDVIGGILTRLNNAVLKLRGIETRTVDEIILDKMKKRYEYKRIALKSNYNKLQKGAKGVVLELMDKKNAHVEFDEIEEITLVPLRQIQLKEITKNAI